MADSTVQLFWLEQTGPDGKGRVIAGPEEIASLKKKGEEAAAKLGHPDAKWEDGSAGGPRLTMKAGDTTLAIRSRA